MSVTLLEVLEAGGYKVTTEYNDAIWLKSKSSEFDELIEAAGNLIEVVEDESDD